MDTSTKYFNGAVALVILSAIMLWMGGNLTVQQMIVLGILLALASVMPLLGICLLIPISLVLWIRHYQAFFNYFGALGGTKLNRN